MLLSLFYELALFFLFVITLPKLLYQFFIHGKYRQSFAMRLGFGFPKIKKGLKKVIWMHAVSVGETKAMVPLADLIRKQHPHDILIISSITETGHAEAKRAIPHADYHVYLPLDFYMIIAPIIKRIAPDIIILCETDYWYNFLRLCKSNKAQIIVVNGKISERSVKRFQMLNFFSQKLFTLIDVWCMQNDLYAERFSQLGIVSDKITVTGNLKFDWKEDNHNADEILKWKMSLGIKEDDKVIVWGSTHHPEETLLLNQFETVWKHFPNLKVLVVPRHPERFDKVFHLLQKQGFNAKRFSQLGVNNSSEDLNQHTINKAKKFEIYNNDENAQVDGKQNQSQAESNGQNCPGKVSSENKQVILIDALGVLRKCYQIADLAIVSGSYTSTVGGHNILEPCCYGVPVFFGPYMHAQTELVNLVLQHKAGLQIPVENIPDAIFTFLQDIEARKLMGNAGLKLTHSLKGSTQKTWNTLNSYLNKNCEGS